MANDERQDAVSLGAISQRIVPEEREDHQTNDYICNLYIRTCLSLLALKGFLMVAAIVLISSTEEISKIKPCDLEKVLNSLNVNYSSPCKYDGVKNKATAVHIWGICFFVLNSIIFLLIMNFMTKSTKKEIKIAVIVIVGLLAIICASITINFYIEVLDLKETQTDTNYVQIRSLMMNQLEKHYTSDNVTSDDAFSKSWNKFFIEYDCCAVNQVTGTNNDFDGTPWCTTSGSCQATASQIPKTCCNYVTEESYENAPTTCHSSVNIGTFKSNCMIPIKMLSTVNIEDYHVSLLLIVLLTIGLLEIAETLMEATLIYDWKQNN